MKKIDISTGKYPNTFALGDEEDYERINKHKWYVTKSGNNLYATRDIRQKKYLVTLYMPREIMRYVGAKDIDHKNHNSLDNQKDNLRLCTHQQNMMNSSISVRNKSGYKGVSYREETRKWRARITKELMTFTIGHYDTKEKAAYAYNEVAKVMHGEYAHLNIIKEAV